MMTNFNRRRVICALIAQAFITPFQGSTVEPVPLRIIQPKASYQIPVSSCSSNQVVDYCRPEDFSGLAVRIAKELPTRLFPDTAWLPFSPISPKDDRSKVLRLSLPKGELQGLCLVSEIEPFDLSGKSLPHRLRWNARNGPLPIESPKELRKLFADAPAGNYRCVLVALRVDPALKAGDRTSNFSTSEFPGALIFDRTSPYIVGKLDSQKLSPTQARDRLQARLISLEVAVYEFHKAAVSGEVRFLTDANHPILFHLQGTGLSHLFSDAKESRAIDAVPRSKTAPEVHPKN